MADRLRPYVRQLPSPEPMVSADSIRMFLYRWMIETGDPVEVVAKGFDLDPHLVRNLVNGRVHLLTEAEKLELHEKLC